MTMMIVVMVMMTFAQVVCGDTGKESDRGM